MQKWLLLLCLVVSQNLMAQKGLLYVRKNGIKKVRTFAEGDVIHFTTKDKQVVRGPIAMVKKDSLYINGFWYRSGNISRIILRARNKVMPALLLTTAGVALSTAGMTLAKWGSFEGSAKTSAGLGYGNFLIRNGPKLIKRRSYRIGRKFRLQTFDLHF